MDQNKLTNKYSTVEAGCLIRVQIPPEDVNLVIEAIINVTPLSYGSYDQVLFKYNNGTLQFKPLESAIGGAEDLNQLPCDEISFYLPKNDALIASVIEAIFESHPYEEPVILIQEVLRTRSKNDQALDNPNKWWRQPDQD